MKKIDHVRKTVYTIVGCLTIISLVFTICSKIAHCEDLGYAGLPLVFGQGEGFDSIVFTEDHLRQINAIYAQNPSNGPMEIMLFGEYTDSTHYSVIGLNKYANGYDVEFENVLPNNNFPNLQFRCPAHWVIWNISGDSVNYARYGDSIDIYINNFVVLGNDGYYHLKSGNLYKYPMWTASGYNGEILDTDGNVIFSRRSTPILPDGHSKGGVLSNYIDSHDLIEDSSDLPHVDVTPPSDPTTNNLLQKILNGLGVLNGSIQSGVLTIGDYIGQGFENVINWFTEPFDSEQFNSDLNEIALINDFSNLKTQVENCGMFDWSDVTPAQSLSFTFDVGGAVLPHTSCVVDFSWYTGTVKNICVAVICTFLVIGLLVTIINQLPNIIGGKSGDKGGGSDS